MHWELLSFKTHLYNQSLTGFQKSYNNKNFNRSKANLPSTRFKFQWKLSPRKVCCRPFVLQRKHMVSTEHQLKVWEKHQLSTITADKNLGCVLPSLVHHSCVEFGRQARLGLTLVDIWVSDLNLETYHTVLTGAKKSTNHISWLCCTLSGKSIGLSTSTGVTLQSLANAATSWALTRPGMTQ